MKISQRAQNITPSATLALSAKAKQMKASGIDVINLSIGEPDFNTPRHVKDAAVARNSSEAKILYATCNVACCVVQAAGVPYAPLCGVNGGLLPR